MLPSFVPATKKEKPALMSFHRSLGIVSDASSSGAAVAEASSPPSMLVSSIEPWRSVFLTSG